MEVQRPIAVDQQEVAAVCIPLINIRETYFFFANEFKTLIVIYSLKKIQVLVRVLGQDLDHTVVLLIHVAVPNGAEVEAVAHPDRRIEVDQALVQHQNEAPNTAKSTLTQFVFNKSSSIALHLISNKKNHLETVNVTTLIIFFTNVAAKTPNSMTNES